MPEKMCLKMYNATLAKQREKYTVSVLEICCMSDKSFLWTLVAIFCAKSDYNLNDHSPRLVQ